MKPIISDISAIALHIEARFRGPISSYETISYEQLSRAHLALSLRNARKRSSVIKYLNLETWEILFVLFAAYKRNDIVRISGFKNELSRVSAHSLCYEAMLLQDGLFYLDHASSGDENIRVALTPKGVEYLAEVLKRSEVANLLDAGKYQSSAACNLSVSAAG